MRDDDLERWILREDHPPQSRARLWIAVGIAVGVLWLTFEWREPTGSYARENWATGGVLHHDKLGPGFGKQGSE